MHDSETLILEELNRLSPAHEVGDPDWADAVRRAGPLRRSRRHALIALPAAFLAVALPAVALS
jgi:hypothetical protein